MLKKCINSLFWTLLLIMFSGCINNVKSNTNAYNKQWLSLLNKAKEENQCTIINFSTSWCMPCKILEKKVLKNDSVSLFLKRRVRFLTVDAAKGLGLRLAMKYGISSFPTLMIFAPGGTLVKEITGIEEINTPDAFLNMIRKVIKNENTLPAFGISPKLLPTSDYPKFYTQYFLKRKQPDSLQVAHYFKQQNNMYSEVNWAVIRIFGNGDPIQKFISQHANKYIDLYGCMVNENLKRRLFSLIGKDYLTKDSSSFKKDLNAYFKLENDLPQDQKVWKRYMITISYWAITGLNWSNFLSSWEEYRIKYGTGLDLYASKLIDEHSRSQNIRDLAEQVLLERIRLHPHDWQAMVRLANLLQREDSHEQNRKDLSSAYSTASTGQTSIPNAEDLYQRAIRESGGNIDSVSEIVYERIQSALFIHDEQGWWKAMYFFKKYLPKQYKTFYKFHTTGYYRIQQNWPKFIYYANAYLQELGGFDRISKSSVYLTNAHLFSRYADVILQHSENENQLKVAIGWMNGLIKNIKNDPEHPQFLKIKKSLQYKLDSILKKDETIRRGINK